MNVPRKTWPVLVHRARVLDRPKGSLGESVLDGKEPEIKDLLAKKVSKAIIAKIFGVSWPAADNFIRTRGLGQGNDRVNIMLDVVLSKYPYDYRC